MNKARKNFCVNSLGLVLLIVLTIIGASKTLVVFATQVGIIPIENPLELTYENRGYTDNFEHKSSFHANSEHSKFIVSANNDFINLGDSQNMIIRYSYNRTILVDHNLCNQELQTFPTFRGKYIFN